VRKKKNIILEKILVEDYASEGKSLGRVEGKVVFIEKTVPGDIVDVRLVKNKKDWAEGYPLQYHSYSADRRDPFCTHFGVCGGCQWQMLPYEKQLHYKQRQVEESLKRIGKISILPPVLPIIGAGQTTQYRNKIEYTFSNKRFIPAGEFEKHDFAADGQDAAGFHARGFFDKVVEIDQCWLQAEPSNRIRKIIRDYARQHNYPFYDFKEHTGFLRNVQIRICTTGEVMVNVVFAYDAEDKRTALLDHLLQEVPEMTTLLYTINTKWNDSIHDLEPVVYRGRGFVTEQLEDFRFKIGPRSFFQTNTRQAEKLYQVTRDFAELTGREVVYDLYCGTGSIGIFVSRQAAKIVGVEMVDAAIADARENAALNNITHTSFFSGDVIKVCNDTFFAEHGRPDVIITDPPRAGMHEKLVDKILAIEAPVVVYVSCNPSTQARDLTMLEEKYTITKIQPVDMFPHTHHIENVVQLKLKH